ncbi:MAG TPA: hypothetical protein PLX89_21690 [Verrucomicrobiota bacterium]|nr:hypothetical protein [Verrucomicrobiota bacterium]
MVRQLVLAELEREQFVCYLSEYESFCGVDLFRQANDPAGEREFIDRMGAINDAFESAVRLGGAAPGFGTLGQGATVPPGEAGHFGEVPFASQW